MARVTYSSIVSNLAGSVGGGTFQRSYYGNTLREKPTFKRTPSAEQLQVRALMNRCHAAWNALTNAQRAQWDQFVNYSLPTINRDKSQLLSGHALFIKYHMVRITAVPSLGFLSSLQYAGLSSVPTLNDAFVYSETLNIDFSAVVNSSSLFFLLKLSYPIAGIRKFKTEGLRHVNTGYHSYATFDITDAYTSVFGSLPETERDLSYALQWFSVKSPILSGVITGIVTVSVL